MSSRSQARPRRPGTASRLRRKAAFLTLLLGLSTALLWGAGSFGLDARPPAPGRAVEAAESSIHSEDRASETRAFEQSRSNSEPDETAGTVPDTEVTRTAAEESEENLLEIRVVLGASRSAAERAEIAVADRELLMRTLGSGKRIPAARWPIQNARRVEGLFDTAARLGRVFEADETGVARVPLATKPKALAVVARTGGMLGTAEVAAGGKSALLRLWSNRLVTIEVVGPDRRPLVDVPVAISTLKGRQWSTAVTEMRTDDDGRVVIRSAQFLVDPRRVERTRFGAFLAFPTPELCLARFTLEEASTEIELEGPAITFARMRLVDRPGGRDLTCGWSATLYGPARKADTEGNRVRAGYDKVNDRAREGGSIRLGPIGLGTNLIARAQIDTLGRRSFPCDPASVPWQTGEDFEIEVVPPDTACLISGRLIDGEGDPLVRGRLAYAFRGGDRPLSGGRFGVDPLGRFDLLLPASEKVDGPRILDIEHRVDAAPPAGVRVTLGKLGSGASKDVGDLAIRALIPFVSGLIVDDRSEPIDSVDVQLERMIGLSKGGAQRWQRVRLGRTRTETDGAFDLYTQEDMTRETLRLRVRRKGHLGQVTEVVSQGQDLRLQMTRTASVDIRFAFESSLPRRAFSAELSTPDGSQVRLIGDRRGRRGYRLRGTEIPPGDYELILKVRGFERAIAQQPIYLAPGESRRLDLDASVFGVRSYEIVAMGADGKPVRNLDGVLAFRTPSEDGSWRWSAVPWKRGEARFVAPVERLDAFALAKRHRPQQRFLAPGRTELRMERVQPVEVSFPGLRQMTEGLAVRATLIWEDQPDVPDRLRGIDQESGRSFNFQRSLLARAVTAQLSDSDTMRFAPLREGKYRVTLRLESRRPRRRRGIRLADVQIRPSDLIVQRYSVPIDAPRLSRVVQSLPRPEQGR